MKKNLFLCFCAIFLLSNMQAQNATVQTVGLSTKNAGFYPKSKKKSRGDAFGEGKLFASVGYGFPNIQKILYNRLDLEGFSYKGIGPIFVRGEYALSDRIGVGVAINYSQHSVSYTDSYFDSNFVEKQGTVTVKTNPLSFIGRLNFHFATSEKVDPYFGLGLGYRLQTVKLSSDVPELEAGEGAVTAGFPVTVEAVLGLRYFINEQFGLYTEIGLTRSLAQLGVVVKF